MFTQLSRVRILAGTACLAMSCAGVLIASDPLPPPATAPNLSPPAVTISDLTLAREVLAAFDADPVLKDVNIVVSVVDRGAVLCGPVTNEEVKKRAEAVVRGVAGIESVKNTCFVQADPDPLLRAVAERMKPGAKSTTSTALPGVALAPNSPQNFLPPLPALPPSDLLALDNVKTQVAQRPNLPGVNILGAPESPGNVTKTSVASSAPGALTGTVTVAKPADIEAAVKALRKNDTRFARLVVELKPDGGLFVTGRSTKASDAWDFARELRKLPGVTRIAVDPELVK